MDGCAMCVPLSVLRAEALAHLGSCSILGLWRLH